MDVDANHGARNGVDDDGDDDIVDDRSCNLFQYVQIHSVHESMTGWFGGSGPA